jgi:FeS assembly SUF system protein
MGIFSFLKGKDEAPASSQGAPDGGTSAEAGDAVVAEVSTMAGGDDLPFSVPEGLNIDALTTPVPSAAEPAQIGPVDPARTAALQPKIVEVLKTVYDPEIPVDIYELGLIYEVLADADSRVLVKMTLTSPACPSAQQIPSEVRYKIKALPEVKEAWVDIVWDPPWGKERMSETARLQLGFF